MQEIGSLIATIGFPIVSFLLAGYGMKYVYDRERKSLDDAIIKLGDLTRAVEHNSECLRELAIEIRGGNNERN